MINFKEWLKELEEVTTSTGDIAIFARPIGSPVERRWPYIDEEDDVRRDKKNRTKRNKE